jgi:hypothetical protein
MMMMLIMLMMMNLSICCQMKKTAMTNWIFSGRPSNGVHQLIKTNQFKRMKLGKQWKPGDVTINWGSSQFPPAGGDLVLNSPTAVAFAIDKKLTFAILSGKDVPTIPWTANKAIAQEWLSEGSVIVVRKVLTGSSGEGIIIIEKEDKLIEAPLYTKYIYKQQEFRVHCTKTKVFDTTRKIRDPKRTPTSWKIRSWKNGFIFSRKVEMDEQRDQVALAAITALGLDFGAVDLVQDKHGKYYILEVNTAPGIEGQTIQRYATALGELAADAAKLLV